MIRKLRETGRAIRNRIWRTMYEPRSYWNKRYQAGGTSGNGSIGPERLEKWDIINQYVNISTLRVLDIACGDLSFWEGQTMPEDYIGADISDEIIRKNKQRYPNKTFIRSNGQDVENFPVDVVLCLDVLFHLKNADFFEMLERLNTQKAKWLFTSNINELANPDPHMYTRPLPVEMLDQWTFIKEYQLESGNLFYVFSKKKNELI